MNQVNERQKEEMKKLANLIIENPDLPVVSMTDNFDDIGDSVWTAGCCCEVSIDYIYSPKNGDLLSSLKDGRPFFKGFDYYEAIEEMRERIHPHDNTHNPEEIWNSLDWIKVILVYSGQLEKVDDVYKERWVPE
ncbi:hypothetical protein [Listeria monocytogenes]|uniref:hypothetical protein n=1 Tax=Listeria monocytogenes TaxID=1639 RepID=UPI00074D5777|nr:hypothetical protein [Listeria monocytogenes]EAD0942166.1 hypothetical protein [Listeria monocytogenes]EAD0945209.1 hypothetical protein [Listeria monocytogenes]EAD1176903.1 hypothetical protein [Listeria monocytogenes]EAD3684270.1 hypothetical protein [Listeria monocytogenes]EAD3699655.1 hypothetical protein [Listeria monocytogenes]